MAEEKSEPLRALRGKHEDVGRADAIERGDADFVKVGSQFAEEDFTFLER